MEKLIKSGSRMIFALEVIRKGLKPVTDRVWGVPEQAKRDSGLDDFEYLSGGLMSERATIKTKIIVQAIALAMAGAIGWAAVAQVDELTKGDARVIPSQQLQIVQSLDGGVVSEILVKDGQEVEAGQTLLKIDGTRATSGVNESDAQLFSLRAKQARLQALIDGSAFRTPQGSGSADEQRILQEERSLLGARQNEFQATLAVNLQQQDQRRQEQAEASARKDGALRQIESARDELRRSEPLVATGAVSPVEILRIKRDISRYEGEAEQAAAQMLRAKAGIGEVQRRAREVEMQFKNEARRDLADVLGKLNAMTQGSAALADKVDKTQVKSPVKGRVQRLFANTVGGVVQPGKDLVEIVPVDDSLVFEAKVVPRDIAFIRPGQSATVKLTAYDFSIHGGLDAKVEDISPDTRTDDRGNSFYIVKVRTSRNGFGPKRPIIPGMTAEVDILTGKKTILSYLLKPILKAKAYAMTER